MELWTTNVGSHMWSMDTPNSDTDLFTCYVMSKKDFLTGKTPKNKFIQTDEKDIQIHEIYNVVQQLKKMNINYIWYLTSPVVLKTSVYHQKLLEIFNNNPGKSIVYSVMGMFINNLKKYKNPPQKKMNIWKRTIYMTVEYIKSGKIHYTPEYAENMDDVMESYDILMKEYENSTMPIKPDPRPYDDFLYDIREALVLETL